MKPGDMDRGWARVQRILAKVQDYATSHGPVSGWLKEIDKELAEPAFQVDPNYIEKLLPFMELFNRYFASEVRGFENIPTDGPVLFVGNHSGGVYTPDTTAFISKWYRERGVESPLIGLAFDAAFTIPVLGGVMRKIGQVPASRSYAARALNSGAAVLVYPGGSHEVFRPWSQRNLVDLKERKGFIRLALEQGVPVVPVVGHGGHDSTIILSRGERLARFFKLGRMRLDVYPILFQIPWGVSTPALPGIPLPAKVTVQVCKPLDWSSYGPEGAQDPDVLQRCYDEITGIMQGELERLARENPIPVVSRLENFLSKEMRLFSGWQALSQESSDEEYSAHSGVSTNRLPRRALRRRSPKARSVRAG